MGMKRFLLVILGISLSWGTLSASERTILIGPKTIGAGWKDNIVIKPEQFKDAGPGDIMTVYTTEAKRTAQIAFQDPKDWQAVSPEYGAMSVQGPIRMKMTDEILAKNMEITPKTINYEVTKKKQYIGLPANKTVYYGNDKITEYILENFNNKYR